MGQMQQGAITIRAEGKPCCFATKAKWERTPLLQLGKSVYPSVKGSDSASQLVAAQ
jgi:hypothetical protein